MTVATTINKLPFTGNSVTTLFGFPIPFIAASDLQVYVAGVLKTLTTDYTISGSAPYPSGANVTFTSAPANGSAILIVRTRPYTQTLDLVPNDPLPADTVEQLLGDHMIMCIQQLKEITDRSFTLPITDTSGASVAIPTPAASQLIGWNALGNALQNYAAASSSAPVSAAMVPVLAATTLPLARTAMGNAGLTDSNTFSGATNTFNNSPLVSNPTGTNAFQAANIGSLYGYASGFVNKLRNACYDVAQRTTSGTVSGGYTLDGWIIASAGTAPTWSQVSFTNLPFGGRTRNSLQITGAVGCTDVQIFQKIEGQWSSPMSGQVCTFQATIVNNTASSITPTLTTRIPTVQDNWGATTNDISGVSLQPIPAGGTVRVAYTFTAGATAYMGYGVILDFANSLNNVNNIVITAADLRVTPGITVGLNSNPPYPEMRPLSMEMLLCQRYFWSSGLGSSYLASGQVYATTNAVYILPLPVPMMAAPTVSRTNVAATNAGLSPIALTALTATIISGTPSGVLLSATVASGLVAGNATVLYTGSGGAGRLDFSAEL